MRIEETKNDGNKGESGDYGCCCNPENFQKMFEKMGNCCPGRGDSTDFSAMKGTKMKNMMEMCCGPKTTNANVDADLQKE